MLGPKLALEAAVCTFEVFIANIKDIRALNLSTSLAFPLAFFPEKEKISAASQKR